ncbi:MULTISPECIES: ABC transporter ATP-binding protein [Halobacterium]|uniref:ABC transporter ATP-binding protein n=1 Tax=Halobacterium TaxID=2239 RepID=UPI00073E8C08|nr:MULTISPECIES: ABC transporter ATP-binding protein [Halobacterium]MCG1003852.1 ABC transporter ATP-binding protein [Halobacterium noricense]
MGLSADITATFAADGAEPFTVDADVDVETGETVVVLGPSGSGKTLLLETVAGFHAHDGRVSLDGEQIQDRAPQDRGFGFVFQDYALFPHRTVRENVAFGQRYSDRPVADRSNAESATEEGTENPEPAAEDGANAPLPNPDDLLDSMGVGDLSERSPPTLSGGEKQRVALARSLAVDPEVLLLDEPLAALDVPTRQSLRDDLADVLADVTAVYVTHDRTTARALADRIVVMNDGEVVQTGTPADVFEQPASPLVAAFTGANVIPVTAVPSLASGLDGASEDNHVAFRPEHVELHEDATVGLRATVERVVREDATYRVTLSLDDATVEAFTDAPPAVGDEVGVDVPAEHRHRC